MLRAVRAMLHGPLPERWGTVTDAGCWRKVPFVLLLASLLVFGFWPRLLTDKIQPSVAEKVLREVPGQVSAAVASRVAFPLTPALSLGETGNHPASTTPARY
jgi:hypothetical protein